MSEPWSPHAFAEAERVPVWTRPNRGAFAAFAQGQAPRFSAWDAPVEPVAPQPDPIVEPDPREAIEAEAFARGFQEGYAAASATLVGEQAAFVRLAEALEALRLAPSSDLAPMLAETVSRLVRQIVGESAVDRDRLVARVQSVAAIIEEDGAVSRLRLHPDDIARLEGFEAPVPFLADPTLAEGTVVAEGAGGWIEDGPAIRMDRLRQALDSMASAR